MMTEAERRKEMEAAIEDAVEDALDEALDEALEEALEEKQRSTFTDRLRGVIFTIAAVIIALGQYSEAVALIGDSVDAIRSTFTHDVEYERLAHLHVGITVSYAESVLGLPQVSRSIDEGISANYFHDGKYLVTLFYREDRVDGFTILSLVDDFMPQVVNSTEGQWALVNGNYESYPGNPRTFVVDHSKTASYYIEKLEKGRAGLFVNAYLGNLSYGARADGDHIASLYEQEVNGTDQQVLAVQNELRRQQIPNFYGEGVFDLPYITKSLLTGVEFQSYFGRRD
jgi:hypothetical protein